MLMLFTVIDFKARLASNSIADSLLSTPCSAGADNRYPDSFIIVVAVCAFDSKMHSSKHAGGLTLRHPDSESGAP